MDHGTVLVRSFIQPVSGIQHSELINRFRTLVCFLYLFLYLRKFLVNFPVNEADHLPEIVVQYLLFGGCFDVINAAALRLSSHVVAFRSYSRIVSVYISV